MKILIGIGTNLPNASGQSPLQIARAAVAALAGLAPLRTLTMSRWYGSAPIPASDQPPYINGVALLDAGTDPFQLLAALQKIERDAGRQRGIANAARTLDLDIIDFGGQVMRASNLVLPHPRAHERAFVLRPVADVCPGWIHPVLQRSVADLLAQLPEQEIWLL